MRLISQIVDMCCLRRTLPPAYAQPAASLRRWRSSAVRAAYASKAAAQSRRADDGTTTPPPPAKTGVHGVTSVHMTGQLTESDSARTCPKFSPAVGLASRSKLASASRTSSGSTHPSYVQRILTGSVCINFSHLAKYAGSSALPKMDTSIEPFTSWSASSRTMEALLFSDTREKGQMQRMHSPRCLVRDAKSANMVSFSRTTTATLEPKIRLMSSSSRDHWTHATARADGDRANDGVAGYQRFLNGFDGQCARTELASGRDEKLRVSEESECRRVSGPHQKTADRRTRSHRRRQARKRRTAM